MKRLLFLLAVSVVAFGADITGTWIFDVETDAGSGSPTFTFKQDGEKLTGTYKGQFGEAPLSGKVTGDKMEFSFSASDIQMVYTGTISDTGSIQGTVEYAGGQMKGTFKGRKQ